MKVITLSFLLLCSLLNVSAEVVCGKEDGLLPNPDDCSSFYSCGNGIPILTSCPPSLHFNPEILVCDRPENVNCNVATTTTTKPTTVAQTTTSTTSKPTTQAQTTTSTTSKPTTQAQTTTSTTSKPTTQAQTTTSTTSKPTTEAQTTTSTTSKPTTEAQSTTLEETTEQVLTTEVEPESTTSPSDETTTTRRPSTSTTPRPTTTTRRPSTTTTRRPTSPTTRPPTTTSTVKPTTTQEPTTTEKPTTKEEPTTTEEITTTQAPTTTTPAPISCPSNGSDIIPDPTSCSSFLVCIDGLNTTVSCPNGMLFNKEAKICDSAENVDCVVVTSSEAPETTTPTDATEPPCDSSPAQTTTTTATPTNATTTTGTPTINTTTTEKVTTEVPTNGTSTTETTTTEAVTTESPVNSTSTEQPEFKPNCPEEGYKVLENPESCSSFYVCVNGNYGLVQCPPGLDYNTATIKCDLPADPQCKAGTTNPPPTSPPYVPPCPENGTLQLTDPASCKSFYICINGNYAQLSCPDDFEFNVISQSCVHPQNSTCSIAETYDIGFEYVCEKDGSYPDPEDCTRYIVCVGDQANLFQCPGGLYFDSELLSCNMPSAVECTAGTTSKPTTQRPTTQTPSTQKPTTQTPTTQTPSTLKPTTQTPTTSKPTTQKPTTSRPGNEPTCPAEGNLLLPNPEDCSQFIVCIEGSHDIVDCPEGYGFNEELGKCDLAENVNCNVENQPNCPSEGSAKLPNPKDCGSYFFCINGQSALIECPDGLNYDADRQECSSSATCSDGTTTTSKPTSLSTTEKTTTTQKPTTTSTTEKNTSTSTQTPTTTSTTQKATTTQKSTTTEEPITTPKPVKCSADGVLLPNPDDCSSFFSCANGQPIKFDCPPGLEFNPVALVCDTPSSANCSVSKKSLFSFLKFWN